MRATTDLAHFAADPVGRYMVGACWLHWCWSEQCYGVTLWARPDRVATAALIESLKTELAPKVLPHQSVVDASRITGVDGASFDELNRYVEKHHDLLSEKVSRLALVRPRGLAGAVTAGFFEVLDAPYPVSVFDSTLDALAWLAVPQSKSLCDELGAIESEIIDLPAPLPVLRAAIRDRLNDPFDLASIAGCLGMSDRSLQRRLREIGRTFQTEVLWVRVESAKQRMVESDAPLTAIALDIGFTSLQHFSNQFRKLVGEAPSSWREKNR